MIVALIVLIPLLVAGLFFYVCSRPTNPTQKTTLMIFDGVVVLIITIVDFGISMYFKTTTGQSVDSAWWPILAALSCLFLTTIVLLMAALLRNMVIFKKRV
ncbi:MAG: hypothetical protein A3C36_02675 [Omnitrophica WOR_2 bacterium RIFCSPHIGHO2_02_FULL_52_10]|nr:MAG: hypothetical protein A3C36_02675 [Omnitrophica WOR_2 bacterium RIFCSPHIGHO2_02_FULL_52_10]